jgi:hypothetical protein
MSSLRRVSLLFAFCVAAGCGDGKPSMAEALAEADKKAAEKKAADEAKKAAIEVDKKDDPLALPWSFDEVKAGLKMGTKLDYRLTGVDAKGKPVDDAWTGTIKAPGENDVGLTSTKISQQDTPQATQVAKIEWSRVSPFFFVERSDPKVTGREKVTVPAGEFDTVVADLEGFFGQHLTVWMIVDKPGIYAKVVDHGNKNEENDQTELVYELTAMQLGE